MRVLITSTDHDHYNETGIVVRDLKDKGLEVELDRSQEVVSVASGQFKIIKMQH